MENTFVLIFSLFREYVCLIEQPNTRLPNARLPNAIVFFFFVFFFYEIAYFLGVDFSRSTNSLIFFLEFIF